jgi:hypothetical protein
MTGVDRLIRLIRSLESCKTIEVGKRIVTTLGICSQTANLDSTVASL